MDSRLRDRKTTPVSLTLTTAVDCVWLVGWCLTALSAQKGYIMP